MTTGNIENFVEARNIVEKAEDIVGDIIEPAKKEVNNIWFKLIGLFYESLEFQKYIHMELFTIEDCDEINSYSLRADKIIFEDLEFLEDGLGFRTVTDKFQEMIIHINKSIISYEPELDEIYVTLPEHNLRWVICH